MDRTSYSKENILKGALIYHFASDTSAYSSAPVPEIKQLIPCYQRMIGIVFICLFIDRKLLMVAMSHLFVRGSVHSIKIVKKILSKVVPDRT